MALLFVLPLASLIVARLFLHLTWLQTTFVALLSLAVARSVVAFYQYRLLNHFGGPFIAAFTDAWHSITIFRDISHSRYGELCEQYGHVARIGPNHLVTDSPDLLTHMSSARSNWTKAAWFYRATRMEAGKDTVFSQIDPKLHQQRRSQVAAGYSGKENPMLEVSIDTHIANLIGLLRRKYISNAGDYRPVDFTRLAHFFALDVITDIAFGDTFGDLVDDEDKFDYVESLEKTLFIVSRGAASGFNRLLQIDWIAKLLLPSTSDSKGMGNIIYLATKLIGQRFGPKAQQRPDMLDSWMKRGLTQEELVTEAMLVFIAGSDTTAASLKSMVLHLLGNPNAYARLQAELDEYVATKEPRLATAVISDVEAQTLPYLAAVIKEGIRIFPPVTDVLPRVAPKGGEFVDVEGERVFFPEGTMVGYAVWSLHRRVDIFGEDARVFRPERWLEAEGETLARMNRASDLMFGWGKSQCLGKGVAMIELRKAVFELFLNFDFTLINPTKPWHARNYMGLWSQKNLWVRVTERRKQDRTLS